MRVHIEVGQAASATPRQEEEQQQDDRYAAARASIESDPNVQALKDMFGAEINPESIEPVQKSNGLNQE